MDVLRTLLASRARAARSTDGSVLIEVIVSAALLVVVVVGIFAAIDGSQRGSARIKERGVAASLAQQDQDRLRGRSVTELDTLNETRAVLDGGVTYTVTSTAQLLGDSTGTDPCASTSGAADYLQISSTVTWPSMGAIAPVTNLSLVAPPPGNGSIRVTVRDASGAGVPAATVTLSGPAGAPSTITGTTDAAGCFYRTGLSLGDYAVSLAKTSPSQYVDRQGVTAPTQSISATAAGVANAAFDYDRAASVTANLVVSATAAPATWTGIGLTNSAFAATRYVATPGTPAPYASQITASLLFPVLGPDGYGVFAGSCDNNGPRAQTPTAQPLTLATVTPGNTSTATVKLPPVNVKITTDDPTRVPPTGATVKYTTETVGCPRVAFFAPVAAPSTGVVPALGVPYGIYDICAQLAVGSDTFFTLVNNLPVTTEAGPAVQNIQIQVKDRTKAGRCP